MLLLSIILTFSLLACSFSEQLEVEDERQPSLFKAGDEWLSLPEVFSKLDFAANNTFALEDDLAGQLELRSTRYWGRVYLDGWPQTIQYFRAHFGIEPPIGKKIFTFAEPRDGCSEILNENLTEEYILFVNRGNCTYGTKSKNVAQTKASGIVIINNEPGLQHVPGPDAHDINFSIILIPQIEGQLIEHYYDTHKINFNGYIVPINCDHTSPSCLPATTIERKYINEIKNGGIINIIKSENNEIKQSNNPLNIQKIHKIEYLLGSFGSKLPQNNTLISLIIAKPIEACLPLNNTQILGQTSIYDQKYVLVRRGGCPFLNKVENIEKAGGIGMILGNQYSYLLRLGVEPRWKGLSVKIPLVMVSKHSYR